MLTLSQQAKDKTLPRIQNTSQNPKTLPRIQNICQNPKHLPESKNISQNPKHFPESKTFPRIQNTSQNSKHFSESKNTSQNPKTLPRIQNICQNPKHVPESKNISQNPKHFRILKRVLESGSVLSLWAMVCSGSFFSPPLEPPGELACRLVKLTLSSRRIVTPAPWNKNPRSFQVYHHNFQENSIIKLSWNMHFHTCTMILS